MQVKQLSFLRELRAGCEESPDSKESTLSLSSSQDKTTRNQATQPCHDSVQVICVYGNGHAGLSCFFLSQVSTQMIKHSSQIEAGLW